MLKRIDPYLLVVGMTGVKMGDRLIQIGCEHGGRLAAIAAKVGLSGRAVAVVPDERSAARARKGAADAGVLIELTVSAPTALDAEDAAFDVAVVDDTGGVVGTLAVDERGQVIRELARVVRPGGRAVFVSSGEASGISALFGGRNAAPAFSTSADAPSVLAAHGFTAPRTLAAREGLVFVETIKPR